MFVKTCENDWETWQVFSEETALDSFVPSKISPDNGEIALNLKFQGKRKFKDQGKLFYRDAWIFEGKRFMSFNFQVDEKTAESFEFHSSGLDGVSMKAWFEENMITGDLLLNVNLKLDNVADGYYAVYSKIVDSFGQPYGQVNYLFEVVNAKNVEASVDLNKGYLEVMRNRLKINDDNGIESPKFKEQAKLFKKQMSCEFSKYFGGSC